MFELTLEWVQEQDRLDPLARFRDCFRIPQTRSGKSVVYMCGNSLGLEPVGVGEAVLEELRAWGTLGVDGHFEGQSPWFAYHEFLRDDMATIVGARPLETVVMNSLTVNLHLMLASFYRPGGERTLILTESGAFPSDQYALETHLETRGYPPREILHYLAPRPGEDTLRLEDIKSTIERLGPRLALVMLPGVQYYTGQAFELEPITAWTHQVGAVAGFDLAHAAGNLVLHLHDWDVDFAMWCSYKYLNGGPGGVGGCFVHERHARRVDLPRLGGWWGNDPATRFTMPEHFHPQPGAAGWQLSNAPVLSMAALRPSLRIFREARMKALRQKSERLTGLLATMVLEAGIEVITPAERGSQLSLRLGNRAKTVCTDLRSRDIVCDYRAPDVVRIAPVPLYNTFEDVWRLGTALRAC